MFTPIKTNKRYDVLNNTVLDTPQPQATSTVRRKCVLESRFNDVLSNEEKTRNQDILHENKPMQRKEDSSLGLLDNMSVLTNVTISEDEKKLSYTNIDAELKYARELLKRCSNIKDSSLTIDTNKENNVNVQNITGSLHAPSSTSSSNIRVPELDQAQNTNYSMNEVIFEPNEITARSSGINNSSKKQSFFLNKGVNFSIDEILAQCNNGMLAQNNEEEFLSGSKMFEQLSIDESQWKRDNTYCMPVASTEKQKLDLSSFSGIMGQLELSLESCAGRKVSVGQYFGRKSYTEGLLKHNEKMTPSLSFCTETSLKESNLKPLVDSTSTTDAATLVESKGQKRTNIPNAPRDIDEDSIISLSTIVNTLQDVNSGTPRRLVDQLLMAQERKKENARKEIYAIPFDRKSMLATPTGNSNKFDENISLDNFSTKLSLDSKTKVGTDDETINVKQEQSTISSFVSNKNRKETRSFTDRCKENILKTESSDKSMTFSSNQDTDIVIGKNTEPLCNCIVGMTNEANIELINNGDRWITYSLKLVEVLGDAQSIKLNIPKDTGLIKPNGVQCTKIEIKVINMCKPIFVALNVILSDMVAKSNWLMKHMIFVNPEQLDLEILCSSDKQELDFQYIADNSTKILPITFHNRNSIDVPVQLSILHDGPRMFSIDSFVESMGGPVKLNESRNELTYLVLKPHKKCIINIKCEKLQSTSMDSPQKQSRYWKNKLIIHVQYNDDVLLKKEVPLYVQLGTCKIQIIDTEVPIIVSRQQGKLINIVNSGNVSTNVSATIVPLEGHPNAAQDFSIKPDNISLQVGENCSFLILYKPQISDANCLDDERYARVKLVAGNNVYYYIVSTESKFLESEKENYLRCHTPNNVITLSPATSPQSVTSSRSGPFDRNSPISMVSSTAVSGNVIPIKATHAALIWNSVKTGKMETKEFTIRNTSDNKIKIQIDIMDDNKSFKFLGERQITSTSVILVMQRQESKTLAIAFNPYQVGPVVGKITIKHYTREESDSQPYKKIPLYGYGGYSRLKVLDTFKDGGGKSWLSFGSLYSDTITLSANVTLQNIGDLYTFAKIKIVPKGLVISLMDSTWHIKPRELIFKPKESRRILIEFNPTKEDFAMLQHSEVSHVATINITYGDEPTRWRIRRLYNKMKESGNSIANENEAFKNLIPPICKAFPHEQLIPGLMLIRDSIQNINDLCTGIHQYEIMLTVEAGVDDTLPVHYDNDDSHMYYSLSDTTNIDEAGGTSFFASQTITEYEDQRRDSEEDQFTITPTTIILNPPIQNEATVTIRSFFKVPQPFQTNLSCSDYLSVVPAEGMLPSRKNFLLKIQCSQRIERNIQAVLEIFTENNKQDVLIKVVKRQ